MRIGVLALQGAFREHSIMLQSLGVQPVLVKTKEDFSGLDGLIIPGGESTTISNIMYSRGIDASILNLHKRGIPIYGTCAGAVILSKDSGSKVKPLGILDISVKRNGYGTQKDSFEAPLQIRGIGDFNGIFIRAPIVTSYENGAEILSEHGNSPVMIRSGNILITTFHPELTEDSGVHSMFLDMVKRNI
ncbi:pyridoxal 5'-phosphate synthase glutaminase subunit PdxT [Candidatus Woesearchaeota archaeon]|nr:pyridoxal 5'-phosphate synthase glutaminase subunit PdxT [Candidatus Woesearchaeota archaeon]